MNNAITLEKFEHLVNSEKGVVFYFSTPECNVCKVLKPKMIELLETEFPEMKFVYVNAAESKELAAQKNIFAVPTILFYFEGSELIRKSRNINLTELAGDIARPYDMLFN